MSILILSLYLETIRLLVSTAPDMFADNLPLVKMLRTGIKFLSKMISFLHTIIECIMMSVCMSVCVSVG